MTGLSIEDAKLQCYCHPKHERILNDHDKEFAENKTEFASVWKALDQRPTNKYFILLILLIIGNLGFQMGIYSKVTDLDKRVAVVDIKLDSHSASKTFEFKRNGE